MSGTDGGGRDDHVDGGVKPLLASDPARIGPYLLLGRLGAGGMGRVFLARSGSGRTVAVKVVHEEHVSDARFRARFRREIEAARKVGERYTAPVLDAGPDDEPPWVATGYVPGLSLEQVVRRHDPLPAVSVHALADELLTALKDIHGVGIVHRDLKPSNVMLTVDGAKVIDFGIARAFEPSVESLLTSTGMVIGSPGFMSPEQVYGHSAGPKSDVFTLGCVLTYAATGRLPFGQGVSNQHAVMFQIVEGEPDLTGVEDAPLRALITRCLTKDVDRRPGVDELLDDPERPHPAAARGAWLPADVVAHLAQQSARLLDAEAAPLREAAVDRATLGLQPMPGSDLPPAAPTRQKEPKKRRRRLFIAFPVVVVLTVGGGTMALLPYVSDGAGNGRASDSGASATPGGSNSPETTSGSPSSSPSESRKGKKRDGKDGEKGAGAGDAQEGGGRASSAGQAAAGSSDNGSDSGSGNSSSAGGSSSGGSSSNGDTSDDSSSGSPPPKLTSYKLEYTNSCVGACSMPIKVSWSAVSGATRYDIRYTNKGSNFTEKNVDTVYNTANLSDTITGPYSGDEICITVRAANKYGASAWAETWCDTVPY
ncbi:protein kinase [Streptomyces sp. NPDC101151]|uniref:serine/threonine-protein kinase n=1 Tax=Streptomyces sp. NPDC101151 TaxID=3366115 RepID=UPI003820A5AC